MTTVAPPAQLWSTMPGWGIAADLTPPELVNARQLKRLRRWLALGLVILIVLCVGGYLAAASQRSSASSALDDVQGQTLQLQAGVRTYAGVTQIQGDISQIQAQISTLMGADVDLAGLLSRFRSALPASMSISSEAITISLTGGTSISTSGRPTIAAVTMSGTGRTLDNLAAFVENLGRIPGVIDVNPTTNVVDGSVAHFTLSLSLTADALSHRFDVSKTGAR